MKQSTDGSPVHNADLPRLHHGTREPERPNAPAPFAQQRAHRHGHDHVIVATYNVHTCVGTDRHYDPERTVRVLKQTGADIVGLQEVSSRHRLRGVSDQFVYFEMALGFHGAAGTNLMRARAQFGNAILSRWPITDVRRLDLSIGRRERRGALAARIEAPGGPIGVMVTHLGLRRRERAQQIVRLRDWLATLAIRPMIVMGDFNVWFPASTALRELGAHNDGRTPVRTYPSRYPLLAVDRIWSLPATVIEAVWRVESDVAKRASDHLPICARARLNPAVD
jgi:endonuclease/exonuclease/phosphatase family metal-dependent hydrolase